MEPQEKEKAQKRHPIAKVVDERKQQSTLEQREQRTASQQIANNEQNEYHQQQQQQQQQQQSTSENFLLLCTLMSTKKNFGSPPNGVIAHQGFMTKRGANYKTWRKRYFILIPDGFLIYFKESDDLHHPLGIIYLHGAFLDRLTAEQCERNRPHSFVVRSTTRRFVLCTESSSDKEIWIKNIERVISQLNIRMKMAADSRISVSTRASNADFYLSSSPPRPNGMAMIDPAELKSIDREIVTLDKKISDCILHANSFESRIPNAPSYIDAEDEMESTMRTSNATNIYGSNGGGVSVVVAEASNKQDVSSRSNNKKGKKSSNNDSDEEDTDDVDDNEDQRSDSNDEESSEEEDEEESEESDEEPAPQPKSRKRQNTLKSKSKRVSSLEKLNADLDNLLTVFVKMNNYLLTIDKQREQTEKDIKELKSHKKLLVKEVKNLREKLKK